MVLGRCRTLRGLADLASLSQPVLVMKLSQFHYRTPSSVLRVALEVRPKLERSPTWFKTHPEHRFWEYCRHSGVVILQKATSRTKPAVEAG